jgi:hypothetical protein
VPTPWLIGAVHDYLLPLSLLEVSKDRHDALAYEIHCEGGIFPSRLWGGVGHNKCPGDSQSLQRDALDGEVVMGVRIKNIFISYRRNDEPFAALALHCHLAKAFPGDCLFMDTRGIQPGADFASIIRERIARCEVLLAVIGPRWLTDTEGQSRLDNPDDFVRAEISLAILNRKLVVPVLVEHTEMPREAALPDDLKPLARCNAFRLRQEMFVERCSDLAGAIFDAFLDHRFRRGVEGRAPLAPRFAGPGVNE